MQDAADILDRFAVQIRWVVWSIRKSFKLEYHYIDDLTQEASLLVLSYAGIVPGIHYGRLKHMESEADYTESRVKSLLAMTLRLDLTQKVSRSLMRVPPKGNKTLDNLIESGTEPSEPSHESETHERMDETKYLRRYPLFARNVLDGVSQPILAELLGVSLPTVERRIRGEKRSFLASQLRRRGIVVEGDESMSELEEAYRYSLIERN